MTQAGRRVSFRELFERSPDAQLLLEGTRILEGNRAAVELYGLGNREQLLTLQPWEFSPERQPDGEPSAEKGARMVATALARGFHRFEWEHRRPDGECFPVEVLLYAVDTAPPPLMHGIIHEVSERKALEDRLRQTHRMEAVGNLAGGIAHDFNNILTALQGYSDLMRLELGNGGPETVTAHLANLERSIERAAILTRQILAFSRKQVLAPRVVDPNQVVEGLLSMLEQLLPDDVTLSVELGADVGGVRVDPSQLELVLVNLILNARDAMPEGGRVLLATSRSQGPDGPEVRISVRDEGVGMGRETLARVFEPFYTTKDSRNGTGLGLASVHGIVGQSGGHVAVDSAPGEGSTFRVVLPAVAELETPSAEQPPSRGDLDGSETVLLCDDDREVLAVTAITLRSRGYQVLEACGPEQALALSREHVGTIDLLLSDVVMPGMGGPALAEELMLEREDMRVLFASGYMADRILHPGSGFDLKQVIEKPYSSIQVLERVRAALDAVRAPGRR